MQSIKHGKQEQTNPHGWTVPRKTRRGKKSGPQTYSTTSVPSKPKPQRTRIGNWPKNPQPADTNDDDDQSESESTLPDSASSERSERMEPELPQLSVEAAKLIDLPTNWFPRGLSIGRQTARVQAVNFTPTRSQALHLNQLFPGRIWKYSGDPHGHGVLSCLRDEAYDRLLRFVPRTGFALEIGGRPIEYAKRNLANLWSCNPDDVDTNKDPLRAQSLENYQPTDPKQTEILTHTCTCRAETCTCPMPDGSDPTVAISLHSLYYLGPQEIASVLRRTTYNKLFAAVYDFKTFPHSIYNEQRLTYSNLTVTEDYIDCRVECLNTDDVAPYTHPAMLWLSKGSIRVNANETLCWTCPGRLGAVLILEFTLARRTNITQTLPVAPIISAVTDSAFVGQVDYRGANGTGTSVATILDTADFVSYSYLNHLALTTDDTLIIYPKEAVYVLASKMVFKNRDLVNLDALTSKAQSILRKYNMTAKQLSLAFPHIVVQAFVISVQNEVNHLQTLALKSSEAQASLNRARKQIVEGYDFVDRLAQFVTRGRLKEVSPTARAAGLLVGLTTLALCAPIAVFAGKTILKATARAAFAAVKEEKPNPYTALGPIAAVAGLKTVSIGAQIVAPLPDPLAERESSPRMHHSKIVWTKQHWFQKLAQGVYPHSFFHYTLATCAEERPLKPLLPGARVVIEEEFCEPTIGTVQVGVGVAAFPPQVPNRCAHNLRNAITNRLLSANEVVPPGAIWDKIYDLALASAPLDSSLPYSDHFGKVQLDMKAYKARENVPPSKMRKWMDGRRAYKHDGLGERDILKIMLKMEHTVKVTPDGPEPYDLRCICILPDTINGTVNPWIWCLQKNLAAQWNGYRDHVNPRWMFFATGLTSREIGNRIQEAVEELEVSGQVYYLASDSSRHDKHMTTPKILNAKKLFKHKGVPEDIIHLANLHTRPAGISRYGSQKRDLTISLVRFKQALPNCDVFITLEELADALADPQQKEWWGWTRQEAEKVYQDARNYSRATGKPVEYIAVNGDKDPTREPTGHGGTTVYNSATIQAVTDAFFDSVGVPVTRRMIGTVGDDNFTPFSVPTFHRAIRQTFPVASTPPPFTVQQLEHYYNQHGLNVEAHLSENIAELDFLSQIFLPTTAGWILTPMPGRILSKLSFCWHLFPEEELWSWLLTVCIGISRDVAHCPVSRVVVDRMRELSASYGGCYNPDKYLDWRWLAYKNHNDITLEPSQEAYHFLSERYDCNTQDLLELEGWLNTNLTRLPATLSHWLIDKMCEVDIGYASVPILAEPTILAVMLALCAPIFEEQLKEYEQPLSFSMFGVVEFMARLADPIRSLPAFVLHQALHGQPIWRRRWVHFIFNAIIMCGEYAAFTDRNPEATFFYTPGEIFKHSDGAWSTFMRLGSFLTQPEVHLAQASGQVFHAFGPLDWPVAGWVGLGVTLTAIASTIWLLNLVNPGSPKAPPSPQTGSRTPPGAFLVPKAPPLT